MDIAADQSVNVRELRDHLAEYLRRIQTGETILVTSHGQPVARLSPAEQKLPSARLYGAMKDQVWFAPDFDEDDPDTIAAAEAGRDP